MIVTEDRITMRKPDNWHNHFRHKGDPRFKPTVGYIASQFARANAMGNLTPPITNAKEMLAYKADITEAAAEYGYTDFEPLMVIMATKETKISTVKEATTAGAYGLKIMPAHGTTNSAHGISDYYTADFLHSLWPLVTANATALFHAEVPVPEGQNIPKSERSRLFVPVLEKIRHYVPELRICVEHIDSKELVDWVLGDPLACATVTPHHMQVTAEEADHDPHLQCMPYPKTQADIDAILKVVMSGHPRFFYGSDNAPHLLEKKLKDPPDSGVFTAPVELAALADLFEKHKALDRLEAFTSEFGAKWHNYPLNEGTVALLRTPHMVPKVITLPDGNRIVPYKHGEILNWHLTA
jgi:dihydroorotase